MGGSNPKISRLFLITSCIIGGRIREWMPGQSWLSVPRPGVAVTWCVFTMIVGDAGVSVIFATGYARTMSGVLGSILFAFMSFAAFVLICLHYQNKAQISFKVSFMGSIYWQVRSTRERRLLSFRVQFNLYDRWECKIATIAKHLIFSQVRQRYRNRAGWLVGTWQ